MFIRASASPNSPEIGTLALGGSVELAAAKPASTRDCARGWYPVRPAGFVCHDETTTLEVDTHPLFVAKRDRAGDFGRGSPYSWGESREAPLYRRIPTRDEQRRSEPELERHLARLQKLRVAIESGDAEQSERQSARLRGVDSVPAKGDPPEFLRDHAESPWFFAHPSSDVRARHAIVPTGSTVAWTDEFFAEGRSWVLTSELFVVPKDRLVRQEPSNFAGVLLDGEKERLPLAFIRGEARPKYLIEDAAASPSVGTARAPSSREDELELIPASATITRGPGAAAPCDGEACDGFVDDPKAGAGQLVETAERWERLAHVGLTGRARWQKNQRFFETSDGGRWIRSEDASVVRKMSSHGLELTPNEKWIDVSIYRGTLVAYAGDTPIFVTLISPGLRGYARRDDKPTKNTTPTGSFRLEWKHLSTTMSPKPEAMSYYLSEVPYTQFFHMPFALHAAYWHDRFGEPRSGGCVNLSPSDSKWLFEWTEPKLPSGWHGVRAGAGRGAGTWVRVR